MEGAVGTGFDVHEQMEPEVIEMPMSEQEQVQMALWDEAAAVLRQRQMPTKEASPRSVECRCLHSWDHWVYGDRAGLSPPLST